MNIRFATLLVLSVLLIPHLSWAYPLRVWVMHNEIGTHEEPVTADRIEQAISRWRGQNILIENSVRNLVMPREAEEAQPFADYIIGDNQFLEEIKKFRATEDEDQPIAVEFIRWNDAYNRIASALSSEDVTAAPDVVQIGSTWVAALADEKAIADISDYVDAGNFFNPSVNSARLPHRDGLFAAPWFVDTRLLFYRKNIIPSHSLIANWNAFLSACDDFDGAKAPYLIGFQNTMSWDLLHNLAPWLWAGGGDILDPPLNSEGSLAGMKFLKKLSTSGCATFLGVSQETLEDKFLDGELATILSGPWFIKRMGTHWQNDIGAALPPDGPSGSFPFVGGSHLAVSQSSNRRGNFLRAAALVKYLVSPDSQTAYAGHTGLLPAHRKALEGFLDDDGGGAIVAALQAGRSYPSIPEWGIIVENEMIRSHIWQIWRDIAQGVSDETLANTARRAAGELRAKFWLARISRHSHHIALAAAALLAAWLGTLLVWRNRYRRILRQLERKIVELKDKVFARPIYREKVGDFTFQSDGSICLRGDPIHFDNNRQARRLIEHMIRQACQGRTVVHCLWGYVLFGWNSKKLQSTPQRLFETMVSKINRRIKTLGAPPLIQKAGRKSGCWKFSWEVRAIVEQSDIGRALNVADAETSLRLDPKNINALERLTESQNDSPLKITRRLIMQEISSLRDGIASIDHMIGHNKLPRGIDVDTAKSEMREMAYRLNYLEGRVEINGQSTLDEVAGLMKAVQHEIASLKSDKLSGQHLWAQVADSDSFLQLISVPQIQSMINNFYNHQTKEREDPRLVQLAMISMLSSSYVSATIEDARSEEQLFASIRRRLNKQLTDLENQLSFGPTTDPC